MQTLSTSRLDWRTIRKRNRPLAILGHTAGFLPIPGCAVYAATRTGVIRFSGAIRDELHNGTGVTVSSLCPGPVYTEFTEIAARPGAKRDRTPEFVHVSAEEVARIGLTAIEHDRPLVIRGFIMKLGMSLVRIMPLSILRLASHLSAKQS